MSKLPSVTGDQVVSAFAEAGFVVVRIVGSHHIMKREQYPLVLSVPVHAGKIMKPGTLRSLIRAAGMRVDDFCALLRT